MHFSVDSWTTLVPIGEADVSIRRLTMPDRRQVNAMAS
jgi:hypothetical protein